MTRQLALALGLAAGLARPVAAQDGSYQYQDENGGAWSNEAPPPPEAPDDGTPPVDVSGDLAAPGASVTFETFHDGLAPYGEWVTHPSYGRVWRPSRVAAGWRPYYYGRWEWTDEGWLWVSDEPWGWAAYHYGRWSYSAPWGWVWVPGYQWAPAWVTWRYSPEYIGWAPLAPGFSVYVSAYPVNYLWWSFVPCARFVGVPVFTVAFTGGHVHDIYHATRPAPPRASVYGAAAPAWGGPARPIVERSLGRPIAPVRVHPVGSPAALAAPPRPGVVSIYRPEFSGRGSHGIAAPAPARPGVAGTAPVRPGFASPGAPRQGFAPAPPRSGLAAPGQGFAPAPSAPRPGGAAVPFGGGQQGVGGARGWSAPRPTAPPSAAPRMPAPAPPRAAPAAPRGSAPGAPPPRPSAPAQGPQGGWRGWGAPGGMARAQASPAAPAAPRAFAAPPRAGPSIGAPLRGGASHGGGGGLGGGRAAPAPARHR